PTGWGRWADRDHAGWRGFVCSWELTYMTPKDEPRQKPVGKYDPSFLVGETAAYERDLPRGPTSASSMLHFAVYGKPDEIAEPVADFLGRTLGQPRELKQ